MPCKIEEIKSVKGEPTSEVMFGFPSQPQAQCPIIDKLIQILKEQAQEVASSIEELRGIDEVNSYTLSDLDNVNYELRTFNIEQLRDVISDLRNWGTGMERLC